MKSFFKFCGALVCALALAPLLAQGENDVPLHKLKLPTGFSMEVWAHMENPRGLALGDHSVFVGTYQSGRVWAIPLAASSQAGTPRQIAAGLSIPLSVAYRQGSLYVSSVSRLLRIDNVESSTPADPVVIADDLPRSFHHGGRYIAFGPDGLLYVSVGAPCNLCDPGDQAGLIYSMTSTGKQRAVFARGVRNSVGMTWDPATREMWFTDNGRDNLGDDLPPDEINHASRRGENFGYPYCHGDGVPDMKGADRSCSDQTPPAFKLGAHVAPLGLRFYDQQQFPPQYRGRLFVAEHGSWNRSEKSGYRIGTLQVKDGKASDYRVFIEGWKQGEDVWGRPADLLVLPDGSMLISDDTANVIYRVTWQGDRSNW